jgi:hypothetical protein
MRREDGKFGEGTGKFLTLRCGVEFLAGVPDGRIGFGEWRRSDERFEMSGLGVESGGGAFKEDVELRMRRVLQETDLESGVSELGILNGQDEALSFGGVLREAGKSTRRLRKRMKTEDGASDYAESSESPGDEFGEIVAGDIFYNFAAAGGESAVWERDGDADDEIAERAETQAECAGIVCGENAADGGGPGPERVDGETLVMDGESVLKSLNGAASFDGDGEIGPGMLDDFVEARGGENEVGAGGRIAPGEFGAAATRDHGEIFLVGESKGGGELVFGGRFEDEARLEAGDGVGGSGGTDGIGVEDCAEFLFEVERRCGHFERLSTLQRWRGVKVRKRNELAGEVPLPPVFCKC